ncbi:uncharacterized protein N7518_002372 [Penicillium psychrosexuale]|uniref:uncharacterized protein n=1 Tax=Penicillium psychrosexuale TaxID=1002107 RepID=UPI002544DDD5|nr:uncharacterized protein N7518_002372 [Penicillium psychrosexuale]KAJ5800304.1 hypothetical protein N7518_002372 [Penicillium psychrosexuale]
MTRGGGRVEGPEESPSAVFLLGFGSRLLLLSTNQRPPLIRGPAMIYRSVLFVYLSSFCLPPPFDIPPVHPYPNRLVRNFSTGRVLLRPVHVRFSILFTVAPGRLARANLI